jgi:anti-anti-sigma factor
MTIRCLHPSLLVVQGPDADVVRLTHRVLCDQTVQRLYEHLGSVAGEPGPRLHLDLRAVEAPTAGALGRLVALHKQLRAEDGELVLFNVGPSAHAVFRLTRLTELLDVRPEARGL